MLTENGYNNIIDVVLDYGDVEISKEFIDEHFEVFNECVSNFVEEANNNWITDTLPRDGVMNALSKIFTNEKYKEWPMYGQGEDYFDEFLEEYERGIKNYFGS